MAIMIMGMRTIVLLMMRMGEETQQSLNEALEELVAIF